MMSKLLQIYHTIKYLKPIQIQYQLKQRLGKYLPKKTQPAYTGNAQHIAFKTYIYNANSYITLNTFRFLNITHSFDTTINWNLEQYGKLWTYNLNYFDCLQQEGLSKTEGLQLITNYIASRDTLKDGLEPYPIALRIMNWVKFLSQHNVVNTNINATLFNDCQQLTQRLEYHLLANHLLENGFALLFGAYYFKNDQLYKQAEHIITSQLQEQILADGAHFECSPMYHQILLHRILDSVQLVQNNTFKNKTLLPLLTAKAQCMLGWLQQITFSSGEIPMFNDSGYGIAPSSEALSNYAKQLQIATTVVPLTASGFRTFKSQDVEVIMNVGDIQPSYQPSHQHADTFTFCLHYKQQPVVVDVGISTYNKNTLRHKERSTISHNTVTVNNANSSNVWGGFRVAQRAKVQLINDSLTTISASHNGYKSFNVLHKRTFEITEYGFKLIDDLGGGKGVARLHLHPDITPQHTTKHSITLPELKVVLDFEGEAVEISLNTYDFCYGFNTIIKATCISLKFNGKLHTQFKPIKIT